MDRVTQISNWSIHPQVDDWLISPMIPIPFFSGRSMSTVCDSYVKDDQNESAAFESVIGNFLGLDISIRDAASEKILENYQSVLESLKGTQYPVKELVLPTPSEIWNYVEPNELEVRRNDPVDDNIYILIECECEWEPEHGLQLVFKDGRDLSRVSQYNGHLTE